MRTAADSVEAIFQALSPLFFRHTAFDDDTDECSPASDSGRKASSIKDDACKESVADSKRRRRYHTAVRFALRLQLGESFSCQVLLGFPKRSWHS